MAANPRSRTTPAVKKPASTTPTSSAARSGAKSTPATTASRKPTPAKRPAVKPVLASPRSAAASGPAAANEPPLKQTAKPQASAASAFSAPFALPGLPFPAAVPSFDSFSQSLAPMAERLGSLSVPPDVLGQIQKEYLDQASALWNQALDQPEALPLNDRRFAAPEWKSNAGSAFMASMYLLNARTLKQMADKLQGDEKSRERIRFAVQQWTDAVSPTNFLALNPEVQKRAIDTKGESLKLGLQHLVQDIRQGHMSQTDESLFEVGRNVATTEGTVVFENPLFQLIEYKPLTEKVRQRPFLLVPPCINKFYILDLQPENSLVRYALSQGQRVFMVSWVNADESLAQTTWNDYTQDGVMRAIQAVQDITGSEQINALGFCIGGTLLASALAVLDARGQQPVASLTLLTAFLDFTNTGPIDVFVDESLVRMREMAIGADSPGGGGIMKGGELATTFSFLRPNDLVWNYVVGNYLKGETPPPFDLLYWNSDSTNLPGPMYCWYLRNTYLENKLKEPGAVEVCGTPLDLGRLSMPTFIYGSREDHIVPWDSAYASTGLLSGPITFVLGASGHIAGVINPPEKKKRNFWTSAPSAQGFPAKASDWFASAQQQPGSWWPTWSTWLADHSGAWVPAPTAPGHRDYPSIEPAPGRYVQRRA